VARAVNRIGRGLQRVANNHVIDFIRRETAAIESFLRGDRAELDCADLAEMAVVLGHGCSCSVNDDYVFHGFPLNVQDEC
jgi:hypothetical protein